MGKVERKVLLKGKSSRLSVVCDDLTDSCSIAIADGNIPKVKYISKELYKMLTEELENQDHK